MKLWIDSLSTSNRARSVLLAWVLSILAWCADTTRLKVDGVLEGTWENPVSESVGKLTKISQWDLIILQEKIKWYEFLLFEIYRLGLNLSSYDLNSIKDTLDYLKLCQSNGDISSCADISSVWESDKTGRLEEVIAIINRSELILYNIRYVIDGITSWYAVSLWNGYTLFSEKEHQELQTIYESIKSSLYAFIKNIKDYPLRASLEVPFEEGLLETLVDAWKKVWDYLDSLKRSSVKGDWVESLL